MYWKTMKSAEDYVLWLEDFDPNSLQTRDARLSFWINTYNMLVLHAVLSRNKHSSSFSRNGNSSLAGRVNFSWYAKHNRGGNRYSLYRIENRILRRLNEPRIHFALNCASASCPALKDGLYGEDSLNQELENAAILFIQSPQGVRIDRDSGRLDLSSIFKWYKKDFKRAAGSVLHFIRPYLAEQDLVYVDNHRQELSIHYMKYDWTLHTGLSTQEPR
jgi:hypothetical protein